ncbi:MAG: LPP20 family lipoprotein [Elusimicrobia bacterium]|nr:LPP20 family lipoprotein [Elusimicrobiota bacterium]
MPLTQRFILASIVFSLALPLSAGRKKPAWLNGPDSKYPETKYVTGVGIGNDLDAARSNARAEIARTFQAHVQQTLTDRQTESSTSVGKRRSAAQGTQKSQIETQLTTDTLLEGVAIAETYFHKKSKKHYALAVLDKIALRRTLSAQIMEKEHILSAAQSRAEAATTPLERARALSAAIETAEERDALSTRRRVIDPAGMAPLNTGSIATLEAALEKTINALPVSVQAEGPDGSKLREAVVAQITELGVFVSSGNANGLQVKTAFEVTPFDRGIPEWTFFQWSGGVELVDLKSGKVLKSATRDGVEGHLTSKAARSKTTAAGEAALALEAAELLSSYLFNE